MSVIVLMLLDHDDDDMSCLQRNHFTKEMASRAN